MNGMCVLVTQTCKCCKYCKSSKRSCRRSETGQDLGNFLDRIFFAFMFDCITCKSWKVQDQCPAQAKEGATYAAGFRLGYWCFCGPGSEKTWTCNKDRPSHQFADGEWDNLALRLISEFLFSKHPVFKCSNILQTDVLMKRKRWRRRTWNEFQKASQMLLNLILACNHLCLFLAVQTWIQKKMSVPDSYFHRGIESGKSHSASSPQTTIFGQ